MNLNELKRNKWLLLLPTIGKIIVILCAFGAFCLSMREKEFQRFCEVKPIFDIISRDSLFTFKNYGNTAFFIGILKKGPDYKHISTPRQYRAFNENSSLDTFKNWFTWISSPTNDTITIYWRDIDVNEYKMKVTKVDSEFYIAGIPEVKRAHLFYSMSNKLFDNIFSWIFPKNWFSDFTIPQDDKLHSSKSAWK
jgi:hypothetical protein